MSKIFSLMGLLLAFMFATCVQPVSASQTKQESIKKAVLYQSLVASNDSNYVLLSRHTAIINEMQLPENYRNLCVFDLPKTLAKSYRTDRTVIFRSLSVNNYLYKKFLATYETVICFRFRPLLC